MYSMRRPGQLAAISLAVADSSASLRAEITTSQPAQAIAPVLLPPAYGAAVGRVERWLILAGVAPLLLTSLLDAGVV